jgi:acyl carrier protein
MLRPGTQYPARGATGPAPLEDGAGFLAGGGARQLGNVTTMPSTFETVAQVITETSDIPLDKIRPEAHAIDDLGIDSLDFLDIVFALDKKFGIKIPLEAWTKEVNEGNASVEDYFVLKNLCARIDELIAAKSS